jgi:FMN phosphatase YigB (HAD superfamily)
MALTLTQYADYLDSRDLAWPAPPEIVPSTAEPRLSRLKDVKAITWSVYGTLLAIPGGEIWFEHPNQFVMDTALEKTVQEFKMWSSMSRTPGLPGDYLKRVYMDLLLKLKMRSSGGERHPEILAEEVWQELIKMLMQKGYPFDVGFYGSLNEFSRKVAYFYHRSIQGTACYPGVVAALRYGKNRRLVNGLIANTQCFTFVQLERGLAQQEANARLDGLIDLDLRACSHEVRSRQPSEKLFRAGLQSLSEKGISPGEVLHIGSRVSLDVAPARRLGMKTALFASDNAASDASIEELKAPTARPDIVFTDLEQLPEVVG